MNIDVILLIVAAALSIIGLIGCIIPGLPGHPLNYAAMLIVQYVYAPFQTYTLIIYAILTALILVIDYMLPIWFAKKFGATKQGIWGSMIGMVLGIIFTPVGMILGLLLGAIIGDLIAGRQTHEAAKSGIATFTGTILAIGLKLIIAGLLTFLVFVEIIKNMF
ncbi:MAG: DUF456 domain-containing protein [Bacteroidetes bacterium]|nr:DUF456 domain-containing protein [Bacteroidota bacterium]